MAGFVLLYETPTFASIAVVIVNGRVVRVQTEELPLRLLWRSLANIDFLCFTTCINKLISHA